MKPSRVFWGVVFILFGVVLLLNRYDVLMIPWQAVWRFWPLVLVFLGLAMVLGGRGRKVLFIIVAAVILVLVLLSLLWPMWGYSGDDAVWTGGVQEFNESFNPAIQHATLTVDAAAGRFTLREASSNLIDVSARSSFGMYRLKRTSGSDGEHLDLTFGGSRRFFGFGRFRNTVDVSLNTQPEWELEIDAGAAGVDFDLRQFKVRRLTLDAGAASARVHLGANVEESRVNINAGASSVRLYVPVSAGCEIRVDGGLSSKRFDGFEKVKSGLYRTENYETARPRIVIDVDAGASKIRVERE